MDLFSSKDILESNFQDPKKSRWYLIAFNL